jgi:hypothetical protein
MILHPGVLGLLIGSVIVIGLMAAGSLVGTRILRSWDSSSSSEVQLTLERQTYLVSVLVGVALWIEIGSALLFVHTVDDLHELFVGAMCATGSLNANPVGWWVLATKTAMVLLFPLWLALNRLDQQAGDFPVVKLKYGLLLALTPIAVADFALQLSYFGGIRPDIITSCCGSLFSEGGDHVTADLASLPAASTLPLFAAVSAVFLAVLVWARATKRGIPKTVAALLSPLVLGMGLVAIISFVSVAYYELPTHHCPFDLFQAGDHFVGYPLMISLFVAVVAALLPGVFQPLGRRPSLSALVADSERSWITVAVAAYGCFIVFAVWPLVFGNLAWELM